MSDVADQDLITTSPANPWPHAIAWLALAAHISIAIAIWQAPQPLHVTSDSHVQISLCLLLAQVNLLTLWLIVGYGPAVRRMAWTLCGWSAIAFTLATAESLQSAAAFVFALQLAATASLVAVLRSGWQIVIRPAADQVAPGESRLGHRQYSILELFAAALGVAIAAALLTRIDLAATFRPPTSADSIQTFLLVSLPAAATTLVSIVGLRGNASLSMQMVLAGMALLLAIALQADPQWRWNGLFEIHAAHWFVVAATLWIFQMCGYRLVRATTLQSAEH